MSPQIVYFSSKNGVKIFHVNHLHPQFLSGKYPVQVYTAPIMEEVNTSLSPKESKLMSGIRHFVELIESLEKENKESKVNFEILQKENMDLQTKKRQLESDIEILNETNVFLQGQADELQKAVKKCRALEDTQDKIYRLLSESFLERAVQNSPFLGENEMNAVFSIEQLSHIDDEVGLSLNEDGFKPISDKAN